MKILPLSIGARGTPAVGFGGFGVHRHQANGHNPHLNGQGVNPAEADDEMPIDIKENDIPRRCHRSTGHGSQSVRHHRLRR